MRDDDNDSDVMDEGRDEYPREERRRVVRGYRDPDHYDHGEPEVLEKAEGRHTRKRGGKRRLKRSKKRGGGKR